MGKTANTTYLYGKVKQEAKIFSNILFILGKVEQDGFFGQITDNYDKIIESEMFYAVNGNFPLSTKPQNLKKSNAVAPNLTSKVNS